MRELTNNERCRLATLAPVMRALVALFRAEVMLKYGVDLYIVTGARSAEDQAKLYAIGRTEPGEIVTNDPPGKSWFERGLAVEMAVCKPIESTSLAVRIDWSADLSQLAVIAPRYLLEWQGATDHLRHFEFRWLSN
jgi:hypothetical protein